jgi:hypothetical protein
MNYGSIKKTKQKRKDKTSWGLRKVGVNKTVPKPLRSRSR